MLFAFKEVLIFVEFIVILVLILLILSQSGSDLDITQQGKTEAFDRIDSAVLNLTKFFIFLFFILTVSLIYVNKNAKEEKIQKIKKTLKNKSSIYNVK